MISIDSLIKSFNQPSQETILAIKSFLSPLNLNRRYFLGRNQSSLLLSKIFDIEAFIDDFTEPGDFWQGKPVVNTTSLPSNALVVNCSMSIAPISALNRLKSNKIYNILSYSDFYSCLSDTIIPLPEFVKQTREDILNNLSKWQAISKLLQDFESQKILDDLLCYRLTGDYSYMNLYSVRLTEQYFEPFMTKQKDEIFVDCGGFDGDTTEEFCKRYPDYKKVFLFEPSATNLAKAKKRLQDFRNIEMIELGVSDQEGILQFNSESGSASCVSDVGSSQISVTTLDKSITEKVTFIKMDLEGWEIKALQGAARHIKEDHPKLAIAVYHHPSDFWRIPEFIFSIRDDYDLYLRHYTEGWTETIMFFVPKN